MPEVLPRSAEMSVRSLVQAFGKVARPKRHLGDRELQFGLGVVYCDMLEDTSGEETLRVLVDPLGLGC